MFFRRILLPGILLALFGLCSCGKKQELPLEESQVVGVTITPVPTPTRVPYEAYPKAIISKDGTTFVNEYLIAQEEGKN